MRGRHLLIQTGLGVSVAIHLSIERTSALDGNAAVNFQCAENHCNPELVACLNDHEGPEADGPEGGKGNRCSEVIRCVYGKQTLDLAEFSFSLLRSINPMRSFIVPLSAIAVATLSLVAATEQDPCAQMCSYVDGCAKSKYDSYCKSWQSPTVCFGL
ncbi:hypothetical protein FOZ63_012261, partial [Perkinsus olseni]